MKLVELINYYTTFTGRMGRQRYWLTGVIPGLALLIIGALIDVNVFGDPNIPPATMVIQAMWLIPSLSILSRRCHDRNYSAAFIILMFVPIINLWPTIELAFVSGTPGDNEYGPDPTSSVAEA